MRRPGSRSNIQLLVSAAFTALQLVLLIGGHVMLVLWCWSLWRGSGGMDALAAFFDLPAWLLWLLVAAALSLDTWIAHHARRQRREVLRR